LSSRRGSGFRAWNAIRSSSKVASRPQIPRRIELRISLFIHLKRNLFSNSFDASCICRNNRGLGPKFPAGPIFYGFRKDDRNANRFLFAQGDVPSVLQKGNDKNKRPKERSKPIGTDQPLHDLSLHSIFCQLSVTGCGNQESNDPSSKYSDDFQPGKHIAYEKRRTRGLDQLQKHQGQNEKAYSVTITAMPRNKDPVFNLEKNWINDQLHNPDKHEHRKINRKSMLMTNLQKIAHEKFAWIGDSFFIA